MKLKLTRFFRSKFGLYITASLLILISCRKDHEPIIETEVEEYSPNYGANIGTVKIKTFANSNFEGENDPKKIIDISDGNQSYCHPDVLFFPKGQNGYKYWMAFTPYFGKIGFSGNAAMYENPTIVVSNDGINWTEPSGIKNPIQGTLRPEDSYPSTNVPKPQGYWSDVDLVFKNNKFYLYFRGNWLSKKWLEEVAFDKSRVGKVVDPEVHRIVVMKESSDGVHWSAMNICYSSNEPFSPQDNLLLSPSMFDLNDKIYSYDVLNYANSNDFFTNNERTNIILRESVDGINFSNYRASKLVRFMNQPWKTVNANYSVWHNHAIYADGYYFMCMNIGMVSKSTAEMLYLAYSKDGVNFKVFSEPIEKWNAYRSCLIYKNTIGNKMKLAVMVGLKTGTFNYREFDVDKTKLVP